MFGSRDSVQAHVEVDYNRIERKLYEQYAKMSYADYFNVQYDLFSIMHYSSNGGVLLDFYFGWKKVNDTFV